MVQSHSLAQGEMNQMQDQDQGQDQEDVEMDLGE
jgi:hypothetical protein